MQKERQYVSQFNHTWEDAGVSHTRQIIVEKKELFRGPLRRNKRMIALLVRDDRDRVIARNVATWHYGRKTGELQKVVSHLSENFAQGGKKEEKIPGLTAAMIAHTIKDQQISVWYSSYTLTKKGRNMYSRTLNKWYAHLVTSVEDIGVGSLFSGQIRYKVTPK